MNPRPQSDTWTERMHRAVNRIRRKEPTYSRLPDGMDRTHSLRWKYQQALFYLEDRTRGRRDWGSYGRAARTHYED